MFGPDCGEPCHQRVEAFNRFVGLLPKWTGPCFSKPCRSVSLMGLDCIETDSLSQVLWHPSYVLSPRLNKPLDRGLGAWWPLPT